MKKKNKGVSFLIVAALLLAGCPDPNKNGDSPAVAGPTQEGIAFSGNTLEITFDKELKSFDARQITVTLDNSVIQATAYTLKVSGKKLVMTFKTNPIANQKYNVTLKAGAVTGKDGGTTKKEDSAEISFYAPPAYTKGSITQNNDKIELSFSKALATMANVSPNPTHITVTRAGKALTNKTDYTLGISGSKLVITLIKPPIAGVYTVALRASAVKSADGGLSMAVSPDPTIEILSSNKLSRQLIKEQPEVTPSPAYTKGSITQNNNKIEFSFNKDLDTTANVSPNPTHITVTRAGTTGALERGTDYNLRIDGKKLVITLIKPTIAGDYTVVLAKGAVKSTDGGLSMAVKPDPTIEILSSNKLSRQLIVAVYLNNAKEVATLIAAGANVNVKNDDGDTPLYLAAKQGLFSVNQVNKLKIVQALIAAGADVKTKDKDGKTPVYWAVRKGYTATVKALANAGADLEVKDKFFKTPLHWAAEKGHKDTVQVLIDGEADLNAKDNYGNTPLFWAAHNGHKATVKALIAAGADLNAKGRYRDSPLESAKKGRHTAIVQLLEAALLKAAGAKE